MFLYLITFGVINAYLCNLAGNFIDCLAVKLFIMLVDQGMERVPFQLTGERERGREGIINTILS